MTIYELPDELIGEIATFAERLKPMLLTCKRWYATIATRDDYNEMVDKRANPIMTLYAYFPDRFKHWLLVSNTNITKDLYFKLVSSYNKKKRVIKNNKFTLEFVDRCLIKLDEFSRYVLEPAHGLTLDYILKHQEYKWDFMQLARDGIVTEHDFIDYPDVVNPEVLYYSKNINLDKIKEWVKKYNLYPEWFCDNENLNLDEILNNMDYFYPEPSDDHTVANHPDLTMDHIEKYSLDYLLYDAQYNDHFVSRLTVQNIRSKKLSLRLLSFNNINYKIVVETPELNWDIFNVVKYSTMSFNEYKKYFFDIKCEYYSYNEGLKWRDVVEHPDENWDFDAICRNRAFN